jgi:hypothetical protein
MFLANIWTRNKRGPSRCSLSLPDSGPAGLIWGKINGEKAGASDPRKYEEFFVGTAQQFKDQLNEENKGR